MEMYPHPFFYQNRLFLDKSDLGIRFLRDEVGHQCPVRPSQLVYPPAVLGRKGTRNPSPLSALSRMRKRCARCDGDAVALERAPWTLFQEWGERVTCLVVTRSKLNGLVGLLYEHYGRSAAGETFSDLELCVVCDVANSCSDGTKFSETEFKRKF